MTKQQEEFKKLTPEEKNEIITKHGALVNKHITHYSQGSMRYFREDIENEGWLYVFRHWNKFDPMKSQRSTWIYNTFKLGCKNAVHKEYGKQRRQAANLVEDGMFDKDLDYQNQDSIIKDLPEEYQEIVRDKVIHNLSSKEITKKYKLFGQKTKTLKEILLDVERILTAN